MPRALLSRAQAEHKVSHLPGDPQQVGPQHRDSPSALSAQLVGHRCLGYVRRQEGSTTQVLFLTQLQSLPRTIGK